MFDLFGDGDDHDDRVESQADLLNDLGYSDVRADHTSEYPDPKKRNGRVPDVTANNPFGHDPVVEIDTGRDTSKRDQRQLSDLSSGLDPNKNLIHVDGDDRLFNGW
ncbi:hypothetical protein PM030_16180 [Halorubrum ezzemoulense]|uniref:hypothetical protein n=1 Tax=Halorubrum ezzemoulense TaxID=337243 RepID=UPI002330973F|nr:hypothetical protein [Halorubrum ezzemoulense]MDB2283401.1 hypothetical protein [Halorubrum ezzemoulense]